MANYIKPTDVISPKAHWRLFDAVLDRGEGNCSYALGTWDGERSVGFRWNGNSETGPLGNPQSRGLPTWTILDPALHEAVLALLPAEKRALARSFLGLRSAEELKEISAAARTLHLARVAKIDKGETPCAIMDGARLVIHLIPFNSVSGASFRPLPELFKAPERFPPVSYSGNLSLGSGNVRIGFDGLLVGSNNSGLGEPQRAYVSVSQAGIVESVTKLPLKRQSLLETHRIMQIIICYGRIYAGSLSAGGAELPCVVLVSLQNAQGKRLLQDIFPDGVHNEDAPGGTLLDCVTTFHDTVLETVPGTESESATAFLSTLNHISHAAGLPGAPCFDPSGKYLWRDTTTSG